MTSLYQNRTCCSTWIYGRHSSLPISPPAPIAWCWKLPSAQQATDWAMRDRRGRQIGHGAEMSAPRHSSRPGRHVNLKVTQTCRTVCPGRPRGASGPIRPLSAMAVMRQASGEAAGGGVPTGLQHHEQDHCHAMHSWARASHRPAGQSMRGWYPHWGHHSLDRAQAWLSLGINGLRACGTVALSPPRVSSGQRRKGKQTAGQLRRRQPGPGIQLSPAASAASPNGFAPRPWRPGPCTDPSAGGLDPQPGRRITPTVVAHAHSSVRVR